MQINQAKFTSKQKIIGIQNIQNNPRELPKLIAFDNICDQFDQIDQNNTIPQYSKIISEQKGIISKNQQIHKKFNDYLFNRKSIKNKGIIERKINQIQDDKKPGNKLIKQFKSIQFQQRQKRQQQQFIILFDQKPQKAINQYVNKGYIKQNTAKQIAKYLININGINKVSLGDFFGANKDYNLNILKQYCRLLNFSQLQFDIALRKLLSKFRLPGQAQQIQRIVWEFAQIFYQINKDIYDNPQQLHILSYAIIMLATDAHNPKQQVKMTKQSFIKNTRGGCPNISKQYLSQIYDRITMQKLITQPSDSQRLYARLKNLSLIDISISHLSNSLMQGNIFLKINKNNTKSVQRKVYLSNDQQKILWVTYPLIKDQQPRFIHVKDIYNITLGNVSQVMKKNKVPEQFDSMAFTIYTKQRTLDLKAQSNKYRTKWVNYIKAILIQKRQQRRQNAQKLYQIDWSYDKIQDIWNTQIFPLWDKYWDYKNHRPKYKGFLARRFQSMCSCWKSSKHNNQIDDLNLPIKLKNNQTLLQRLWKYGLPKQSRKILWCQIIGNNLATTSQIIQEGKKRKKNIKQLRQRKQFKKQIIDMGQTIIALRSDIPPISNLLNLCQVFSKIIPQDTNSNPLNPLLNIIHMHHFLPFFRRDLTEIQLRINLFQYLLEINVKSVYQHFKGLKIQTKMYLLSWFLSLFSICFKDQLLYRIWDNFLLDGQIFLFKVGITLIKYYQIQLKMCTFDQGLNLLRLPKNTSIVLFFQILQNQINIKQQHYQQYIQKRKHAIIKTKIQSIPLE